MHEDYAHLNSLAWVDGDIIAGFRHCNNILRIDGATGDVRWHLGLSIYSRAEWEAGKTLQSNRGPAPLDFVNDPVLGFSGQHGGHYTRGGNLLVYDNNSHCTLPPGVSRETLEWPNCWVSTRAVEYAIDTANGEAVFQREFRLRGPGQGGWSGHAEPMANGDWFVSWSVTRGLSNSAVQVDAETDTEKLTVTVEHLVGGRVGEISTVRVVTISPVALAPRIEPLEATLLEAPEFHAGPSDRPRVIVAFNQPVADPATAASSATVTGATMSVAPHIEAGAPAHAYAFTLTPGGDDEILFTLNAGLACSSGGVCTAAGATLGSVPGPIVIPGPLAVAFGSTAYLVTEGSGVDIALQLDRAHGRSETLAIPIEVQGGSATPGLDFSAPSSASFGSTDTSRTFAVTVAADKLVEGDETVILGFPTTLPRGVSTGATTAATVTVLDATDDAITFTAPITEVAEGNSLDLTFSAGPGITFTADQTIDLAIAGSAQDADYTVSAGGATLNPPYAVTLPAGANRVAATIRVVDDAAAESSETIAVTASRNGHPIGSRALTIPASDGALPKVTAHAPSGGRPVEGTSLTFTLRRTGATTAQLPVTVSVTESGAMLGPNSPVAAAFEAGSATATVSVPTTGDSMAEDASEITLSVIAAGATDYEPGVPQSATATVADDDRATLGLTVMPSSIAEGATARIEVAIANGVTFAQDQEVALAVGGAASAADYTLSAGGGALAPPYLVTLRAGAASVEALLTAIDDDDKEDAETVTVSASIDSTPVGSGTITIQASDSALEIRVAAVQTEVTEGDAVEFTVTRTNSTEPTDLPELTVATTIVDAGNRLDGTAPASVTFGAGAMVETLSLATKNDTVVRSDPGEVTITLAPDAGSPPEYVVSGSPARVSVVDDDRAEFALSVSSTVVAEGERIAITVAIANGVTFDGAQTLTMFSAGKRGTATYGTDYSLVVGRRGNERESLNLRVNQNSATGTIRVADDALSEGAETIVIVAAHDGDPIAAPVTITIAASDGHPDTLLPPELDTATIDGDALTLLYTKPLDDGSGPATDHFAVRVDGSGRGVSGLQVEGAEVQLTLTSAAAHGERVEFDYTPGANPLRDIDGNAAPAESGVTAVETIVSAVGGGAAEGDPITFKVFLSRAVASDLVLDWSLADGTAQAGIDYEANPSGSLTIAAGDIEGTIEVLTLDDSQGEPDETFTLTLTEPSGFPFWAKLQIAAATGTIKNDDAGPPPPPPPPPPPDPDGDGDTGGSDTGNGGDGVGPPRAAFTTNAVCRDGLCRGLTGEPVTFDDASTGAVRFRTWDFGDGVTSQRRSVDHAWSEPGFYEVTLRVGSGADESSASKTFLVVASDPAGACSPDVQTLCLQDSRYAIEVDWRSADGAVGEATVVHAGTNDSGMFWFFSRDNWEILIKVLDGCKLNGNVWVYGASTTDLGYAIRVTDTVTGAVKEYRNEPGLPAAAITDPTAFNACAR